MTVFLIILACVVWYAIGFWGAVWNITRAYSLTSDDWGGVILFGLGGVITFLVGWALIRRDDSTRVVFKQRKK